MAIRVPAGAANESQHSAMRAGHHPRLECRRIKGLWRSAVFALNKRNAQGIHLRAVFLLATNQVTDVVTAIGAMPGLSLGFYLAVLRVGQDDGLAHGEQGGLHSNQKRGHRIIGEVRLPTFS